MTLEQQLFALLEQHDLSSLSITAYAGDTGKRFIGVSALGGGKAAFDTIRGNDDLTVTIGSAIGELNVKRYPPVVAVDALQPMEMAA